MPRKGAGAHRGRAGLDGEQVAQFQVHGLQPAEGFVHGADVGAVSLLERGSRQRCTWSHSVWRPDGRRARARGAGDRRGELPEHLQDDGEKGFTGPVGMEHRLSTPGREGLIECFEAYRAVDTW